jgi:putative ABC transport system permease protein
MLKNFFILAVRNLFKNRTTSIINILGFSLGIACCLIIYFKVTYELSFDRYHSNSANTFRVVRQTKGLGLNLGPGEWEYREGVYGALPDEIKKGIPEVKEITSLMFLNDELVKVPNNKAPNGIELFKIKDGAAFAEPSFFRIFDFNGTGFKWIDGSPEISLTEPNSIVLTQKEAEKLFHGQNPIGKTITLFENVECKITGLISDLPANSDFPIKLFVSYISLEKLFWKGMKEDWSGLGTNQCFVMLHDVRQKTNVENKIKIIHSKHVVKEISENRIFKLQPLKELHTDSRFGNFNNRVIGKETILALMLVGLFIIIIASINYANLSLARSGVRTREVGIRKIFGSNRLLIIGQFLGESFILTLIALNIGVLSCKLILSLSPSFIGIPAEYNTSFDWVSIAFAFLLLIVISIFSGSYPAFVVSGYKPIEILKNRFLISQSGKLNFTRTMVVLQFTISLIMIICTIVVLKQLQYLDNVDLGYNRKAVIIVDIPNHDLKLMDRFRTGILKNPKIRSVSLSSNDPGQSMNWTDITRFENKDEKKTVTQVVVIDSSYIETYGLNLIAGRNISSTDTGWTILVNQQLIKDLEFKDINAAIGAQVRFGDLDKVTIVGVLRDYHSESLRNRVRPAALLGKGSWINVAGIRLSTGKLDNKNIYNQFNDVLKFTRETWQSVYPDYLYEYTFLEDKLNAYYRNEQLTSQLFNVFSFIAIFIGCLGIFGLAFYTCEQKSKEIAIRKVNGASTKSILGILSKDYMILLGIAFIIASPVGWYAMHKWLQGFAYKTEISWWVYVLAGFVALIAAGIMVSWQSIRAAMQNPVEALKYE